MPGSCLAVIPARGGSKRVPNKNLIAFGGKPLIAHTITAALTSGMFARVVVSTDSWEIADVSRAFGAEAPFVRDAELSDDHTPVSAVSIDALSRLDPSGSEFEAVCQLLPNCPLTTSEDIVQSYDQFCATGAESQISVVRFGWLNPWWAMRRGEDMCLEPLFERELTRRSQDLPELYCPTGAVWWASPAYLHAHGSYHGPGRTGWEIAWQRGVDIDTVDDLSFAEALFSMTQDGNPNARGTGGA